MGHKVSRLFILYLALSLHCSGLVGVGGSFLLFHISTLATNVYSCIVSPSTVPMLYVRAARLASAFVSSGENSIKYTVCLIITKIFGVRHLR